MTGLQTTVFVFCCAADVLMMPLTLALKGSEDLLQYVWLGLAAFSVLGFATRIVLRRRHTPAADAWAEALVPTRLGAMMFFGVVALVLIVLPGVAFFG